MEEEKIVILINIAKDFSTVPSSRYKKDGPFSGQEFRNKFLEPHFKDPEANYLIKIILDGVEGYATSFLEESFGGLARIYGKERCLERLEFISLEDRLLVKEIKQYIEECDVE